VSWRCETFFETLKVPHATCDLKRCKQNQRIFLYYTLLTVLLCPRNQWGHAALSVGIRTKISYARSSQRLFKCSFLWTLDWAFALIVGSSASTINSSYPETEAVPRSHYHTIIMQRAVATPSKNSYPTCRNVFLLGPSARNCIQSSILKHSTVRHGVWRLCLEYLPHFCSGTKQTISIGHWEVKFLDIGSNTIAHCPARQDFYHLVGWDPHLKW